MKYTEKGEAIPETMEEYESIHGKIDYVNDILPAFPMKIIEKKEPKKNREGGVSFEATEYLNDKGLNYEKFAKNIIAYNDLISYKGMFFTPDGEIPVESLRRDIAETLSDFGYKGKYDTAVNSIINTVRDFSAVDSFAPKKNTIYFSNGELDVSDQDKWIFYKGRKTHTPYRLNIDLNLKWVSSENGVGCFMFSYWLHDVFYEDDIPTIQQMLGSCLLPENKLQEAFIMVGSAGVGKSVLGYILHDMFGNAFGAMNLTELDENKFVLANVENKLVIYDDDLQTKALTDTGVFKKLITSELPIKAERKGQQPYMFTPYATVICNTNQMIQALYDDSEGFFRRLHPIIVQPKKPNRRDIFNINEKIVQEKEKIIIWILQGLWDLRRNRYRIAWSDRSREFLEAERNPFKTFFDVCFEVTGAESDKVSLREIEQVYKKWCRANAQTPSSSRRLGKWVNNFLGETSKCLITKRRITGYKGVTIVQAWL